MVLSTTVMATRRASAYRAHHDTHHCARGWPASAPWGRGARQRSRDSWEAPPPRGGANPPTSPRRHGEGDEVTEGGAPLRARPGKRHMHLCSAVHQLVHKVVVLLWYMSTQNFDNGRSTRRCTILDHVSEAPSNLEHPSMVSNGRKIFSPKVFIVHVLFTMVGVG